METPHKCLSLLAATLLLALNCSLAQESPDRPLLTFDRFGNQLSKKTL